MSHRELNDEEFLNRLAECTLDPSIFSHEAHLRLAWLKLNTSAEEALVEVPKIIQNYTAHLGAEDKYHHTVTLAAVKVVEHFKALTASNDFSQFIEKNDRLLSDFKGLLATHYSFDIFSHPEAKKIFIQPNLRPFDND